MSTMRKHTGSPLRVPAPPGSAATDDAERAEVELRSALGARIREARKRLDMSGRRLAQLAEVTPGFISRLELGQASPSISTLFRIGRALEITFGDLFDAKSPPVGQVLRAEDWDIFQYPEDPFEDAVLAVDPQRRLSAMWSRLPPGAATAGEAVTTGAEAQFVFVLRGTIELRIDGDVHTLEERSSIMLTGSAPHTWANRTDAPAEIVSVVTPAV
jgi:transcriptional regulator with XRE-family HTH domain